MAEYGGGLGGIAGNGDDTGKVFRVPSGYDNKQIMGYALVGAGIFLMIAGLCGLWQSYQNGQTTVTDY